MNEYPIKKALLSVSDKTQIVELAKVLIDNSVEIISSGGTGKVLSENNISYTPIEEFTGNPEAFGGRMKTISFQVGSALLYNRNDDSDVQQAKELSIDAIDLVVCNLYPFQKVYNDGVRGMDNLVEYIDIGGPTMIRAAAKNYDSVCVLTDPRDYDDFLEMFQQHNGATNISFRKQMALKTFQHTADYEATIAEAFAEELSESEIIDVKKIDLNNAKELRYGENPHQKGWVVPANHRFGLACVQPLQGKELSYNNFLDADAALRSNRDLVKACNGRFPYIVTIIKHSNPCGAAAGESDLATLEEAWSGDPISSFGSIICFNKKVTKAQAQWLSDKFVEVILAPEFTIEAREVFQSKKNLRLICIPEQEDDQKEYMVKSIDGGYLIQEEDQLIENEFQNVTQNVFDSEEIQSLVPFGLMVTKHLRSNAISLIGKSENGVKLFGAGMGNPNRLISLQQAVEKVQSNGKSDLSDLILFSDAFFPFADNIELAHESGIQKIVEPGGSIKDKDVIAACDKYNMQMIFTGKRHFRH